MSEPDLTPLRSALVPFVSLGRAGLLPALHAAQAIARLDFRTDRELKSPAR